MRGRDSAGGIDEARCMMEHAWVGMLFPGSPMPIGSPKFQDVEP